MSDDEISVFLLNKTGTFGLVRKIAIYMHRKGTQTQESSKGLDVIIPSWMFSGYLHSLMLTKGDTRMSILIAILSDKLEIVC